LFAALERAGARRLTLAPLPAEAIAEVAADEAGAPPGPDLLDLVAGAGGNPRLVVDLLAGLRDENALDLTGGDARPRSARPPERLGRFARDRLARLGREARHLVELAAVLGRPFTPEDVAGLLGTTPAALLPALEEALGAGLLAADGDAIAFRHELVRRAILTGLPGPVRCALHRQAGEQLLACGGPPGEAARHLALGARRGDHPALARPDAAAARPPGPRRPGRRGGPPPARRPGRRGRARRTGLRADRGRRSAPPRPGPRRGRRHRRGRSARRGRPPRRGRARRAAAARHPGRARRGVLPRSLSARRGRRGAAPRRGRAARRRRRPARRGGAGSCAARPARRRRRAGRRPDGPPPRRGGARRRGPARPRPRGDRPHRPRGQRVAARPPRRRPRPRPGRGP